MHFNDHSLQWLNVFLQSRITLAYKRRSIQQNTNCIHWRMKSMPILFHFNNWRLTVWRYMKQNANVPSNPWSNLRWHPSDDRPWHRVCWLDSNTLRCLAPFLVLKVLLTFLRYENSVLLLLLLPQRPLTIAARMRNPYPANHQHRPCITWPM